MEVFNFKRSVKATMWVDESIFIEAENYEEALKEAKIFLDEPCDDVDESTVCWNTFNQLSPSENDGDATVRLYDENWDLIADNAVADFTPMNEALLHEAIADIAFNFGWEHHDEVDNRELMRCIIAWAKEFEQLHRTTNWADKADYLEAVDSFSSDKIAEYLLSKR